MRRLSGAFADPGPELGAATSRVDRPYFVRNVFALQSAPYGGGAEQQISAQPASEAIVPSTARLEQLPGRLLGLSPVSQCPIAVEFFGKGAKTEAIILKPGQTVKPFGGDWFSEFRWGLPFGWLGGGVAYVGIAAADDGQIWWGGGDPEVMFHRVAFRFGSAFTNPNWPIRFPWPNARSLASGTSGAQGGQPVLALSGTRVLARLDTAVPLAAPGTMRVAIKNTDHFDDSVASWVEDVVWPMGVAYPIIEVGTPLAALGGDNAILSITDVDGNLAGLYVEFIRYGRL